MKLSRITRSDRTHKGKERLFAEISAKIIDGGKELPPIKKGDNVLVLYQRTFKDSDMDKLIGKYVHFWEYTAEDDIEFFDDYEGEIRLNEKKYWEDGDYESGKYVLIDIENEEDEESEELAICAFDNLNWALNLTIIDNRVAPNKRDHCSTCAKLIPRKYHWCPYCGNENRNFIGR